VSFERIVRAGDQIAGIVLGIHSDMISRVDGETGERYRVSSDQGWVERSALTVARCRAVIHLAVGRFIRRPGDGCRGVGQVGSGNVGYEGWGGKKDILDLGDGQPPIVDTNIIDGSVKWVCPDCFSGTANGGIRAFAGSECEGAEGRLYEQSIHIQFRIGCARDNGEMGPDVDWRAITKIYIAAGLLEIDGPGILVQA